MCSPTPILFSPATPATLLFFEQAYSCLRIRTCYSICWSTLPPISTWLAPSSLSAFYSNVPFSQRPNMTILLKLAMTPFLKFSLTSLSNPLLFFFLQTMHYKHRKDDLLYLLLLFLICPFSLRFLLGFCCFLSSQCLEECLLPHGLPVHTCETNESWATIQCFCPSSPTRKFLFQTFCC